MIGPHLTFPLTQREWHEQAAAITHQPPTWTPPPVQHTPPASPFTRNPLLVKDDQ